MEPSHGLIMDEDEMRRAGLEALDMIIDHFLNVKQEQVIRKRSRRELDEMFDLSLPVLAQDLDTLLEEVREKVFSNILHLDHPRCFAFVPGPSNFASVIGALLASGFNVFNGIWLEASGAAAIELAVIRWLNEAVGYGEGSGGIFVSGGSAANMTAICVAREKLLGDDFSLGTVYFSDQTHSSVNRALKVLGIPAAHVRILSSSDSFTLEVDRLASAVAEDRSEGLRPFLVVGNAGTTNTGAVDPLADIGAFCARESLWFHVDGAIGASASFCERGKELLKGVDLADSITLDPHKWLFQSYEIGCLLVKNREDLLETFDMRPEYLQDAKSSIDEPNFADFGMQLTRDFKALKLWLTFKAFGSRALADALEWGFHLAEFTEEQIRSRGELDLMSEPSMGILCFRYVPKRGVDIDLNLVQQQIAQRLVEDGFAMLTTTVIRGKTVLRMCTINPRTTHDDIVQTLDRIERIGTELSSSA
jgi:aromatic-L-amino-acid decarboxylase